MSESTGHAHPTCHIHPGVLLRCPACQGAEGGRKTSVNKTKAARRNASRKRPGRRKT